MKDRKLSYYWKRKKLIPKGYYCYSNKGDCPYYKIDYSHSERFSGYCKFLEKGDFELTEERKKHKHEMIRHLKNGKKVKRLMTEKEVEDFAKTGNMSLLWDKIKECGINKS